MQALKTMWMKEPVVCFSIAIGTIGKFKHHRVRAVAVRDYQNIPNIASLGRYLVSPFGSDDLGKVPRFCCNG